MKVKLGTVTAFVGALAICAVAAPCIAQDRDNDERSDNDVWRNSQMMPAPLAYPEAPPGAIAMFHWTDYTHTNMAPGSVNDRRWEMYREENDQQMYPRGHMRWSEYNDPASLEYPMAAPGSLHMRHWRDYTETELAPDSVDNARWKRDHPGRNGDNDHDSP